jgi:hypothetical protein
MKPWMAKETIDKVNILGSDYEQVLLDLVDKENLPAILGGECKCGSEDGLACRSSGVGPWLEGRQGWGPRSRGEVPVLKKLKPTINGAVPPSGKDTGATPEKVNDTTVAGAITTAETTAANLASPLPETSLTTASEPNLLSVADPWVILLSDSAEPRRRLRGPRLTV